MQFLTRTLVQLVTFLSQTLRSLTIIHILHSSTTRTKEQQKNWSPTVSSKLLFCSISSVQLLSRVWLFATPWITARQASSSITTPGVYSNSCPSSRWCHPAISSSVIPFSSCPQSFPASESFPKSQLFTWGGQSTGVSASASFPSKKSHGWSPSEWTDWISLQSKGPSRVFSNTTVQKHQLFGAQLSSQSNSHIQTRPL